MTNHSTPTTAGQSPLAKWLAGRNVRRLAAEAAELGRGDAQTHEAALRYCAAGSLHPDAPAMIWPWLIVGDMSVRHAQLAWYLQRQAAARRASRPRPEPTHLFAEGNGR